MQDQEEITRNGFTLAELIVVVTILAILGTIGFVTVRGYSREARDATRISDLKMIEKAFTLHKTVGNDYPKPDNEVDYTYSGSIVWSQGEFGEESAREIQDLTTSPIDPLSKNKYTYSLHSNTKEYQISGVLESNITSQKEIAFFSKAYGEGKRKSKTFIVGNYNRVLSKSKHPSNSSHILIIALPSITSGDTDITDVWNLVAAHKLSYSGSNIVPSSYLDNLNSHFSDSTMLLYNISNIEIFNGSNVKLGSWQTRVDILKLIHSAYISTPLLEYDAELSRLIREPLDLFHPSKKSLSDACSILKNGGLYDGDCFEEQAIIADSIIDNPNPCGFTVDEVSSLNTFFSQDSTFTSKNHIAWCENQVFAYSNISGAVPEAIGKIDVTHFHMNNNAISSLPNLISNWKNIKELHIANNNISVLPNSLENITSLTSINLAGNPLLGNISRLIDINSGAYTQLGITNLGYGMTISGVGFHPNIIITTF